MIKKVYFNKMKKKAWNSMNVNDFESIMPYHFRKENPDVYAVSEVLDIDLDKDTEKNTEKNKLKKYNNYLENCIEENIEIILNGNDKKVDLKNNNNIIQNIKIINKSEKSSSLILNFIEKDSSYRDVYIEIYGESNSKLDVALVFLGNDSNNITTVKTAGSFDSEINLNYIILSPKNHHILNYVDSNDESKITTRVVYLTKDENILDFMHYANHTKPLGYSNLEIEGVMQDFSKKLFKGIINFEKGAKGAEGLEKESVIAMSDDIVNKTLPILFCKEEDVIGNHGCTIGRLDENILFYIQSRGYTLKEAKKLLIISNFYKLLEYNSNLKFSKDLKKILKETIVDLL